MMRLLLSVLPYFQNSSFLVPHLGNACISAYLKENIDFPLEIKNLDLRTIPEINQIWSTANLPQITFKNLYVSDIYELPLITSLISNFRRERKIKSILEPEQKVIEKWALERSLYPSYVLKTLKNTNYLALKYLRFFSGYDVIGFSTYTSNLYFSVLMALLIKISFPKSKIVFGGPQITQGESSRELLIKGEVADFVVLGEGEKPLLEILNTLKNGGNFENINGVKTLANFSLPDTFSQTADLEKLPTPDFTDTNFSLYNPELIPIYSNRGCPFRCHFCSEHSLFGKKFKRRSPEKVIKDFSALSEKYKLNTFTISDSLVNSSEEWLENFASLLIEQKEKWLWGGYFRAEMGEKQIVQLKKAGLSSAILGVESFSQGTLKNMNKRKIRQEIIDTIRFLVENEINTFVNIFIGYPGESEEDFLTTLEVSQELINQFKKKDKLKFFRLTCRNFQLRPFSTTYNHNQHFGLETSNWLEQYPEVEADFSEIYKKTLCSFRVTDVSLMETWQRLGLMRQLRELTI